MNLIKYLWQQSWQLLLLSTVTALLSGLSGAILAGIIGKGVSGAAHLQTLAAAFFGTAIIFLATKTISEIALLHLTQRAVLRLRIDLSNKLLATPIQKLQALGKDGLLAVLTRDVDVFVQSFMLIPMIFGNVIMIVTCFAYMTWISWQLALVVIAGLCFGMFGFHIAERRPLRVLHQVREQVDVLYEGFRNLIDGAKELQLNSKRGRAFISDVIESDSEHYRRLFVQGSTGYTWLLNIGSQLFYLIIGLVLFVVPVWLPQPPGVLATITLILLYLIGPIAGSMGSLPTLAQAGVALAKMQQLAGELRAIPVTHATSDPFARESSILIELKDVVHHYESDNDDRKFKLGPLNLQIQRAETMFIVGGNGSGKTTLAMLLLGLFEREGGTIRLNDVLMDKSNQEHYRQYFSAVFADFHLFERLLTTQPQLSEQAAHYIEVLGMSHKVKVVDGKFSTINLSTGQRKRLALVSSYLEDRPVYLFDEWAADQDPVFKRIFYAELLPELKARGKSVIVISHDDTYFKFADRIIKLEDGNLKEITAQHPVPTAATAASVI